MKQHSSEPHESGESHETKRLLLRPASVADLGLEDFGQRALRSDRVVSLETLQLPPQQPPTSNNAERASRNIPPVGRPVAFKGRGSGSFGQTPTDLMRRDFWADRPDRMWVSDIAPIGTSET